MKHAHREKSAIMHNRSFMYVSNILSFSTILFAVMMIKLSRFKYTGAPDVFLVYSLLYYVQ